MASEGIDWEKALALWTIYNSPRDYPGQFVARLFVLADGESHATDEVLIAATLDELRAKLPPDLYRMVRDEADESHIVETWL